MPGGFREIREYDDGEEEKQERREKAEASLKAYDRYRKYFDDARRELRENSSSPKEAQESQARIEAILAEASRQAEENITPPTERLVEQQAPSVPPQERPLPERRVMSQDSTDPDTRETPEDPVDSQRPKPEPREQIFTLPQQEREQHSIHGAADSRVRRSIDSVEEYQQALHAFPDEAESPDFTELDYQVREFFSMRRNFPEGGPVEFIAGSTGIPAELVQKWMDGVERPEFLTKLEQRATREASMKEASEEKPDGVETVKFKPSAAEDRTSTLPASVREIVSDESDIEFLSRLSKNWDALHELGMTDTAFERIEEIASKHFRFTDSKYEILRATEDKELRTKLIPTKGTPLTKVVEATRTLVDDEATNQLLDKIKATKGKFTIDSWESYQLVLRALPLTLAEPNFEALHRVIKGRLLLGDCIGHTKAREYGRTEVTDKRVTYFTYTRKNLKAFEKIELFCNTHLEKIVKRHRRLGRSGIRTIEDVKEKLSRYYGGRQIFRLSSYPRELEFAKRTLVIYPLSRLGLRLPLLNKYDTEGIRIPRYILERSFLKRGFNKVLELAVLIPKKAPEKGWQWVELLRKPRGKENITARMGWIQIPVKVQSENISKVIEQLGIPTKPEEREKFFDILKEHGVSSAQYTEWKERFGPIETLEQKMDAFAYLIGVMLSDGTVQFHEHGLVGAKGSLKLSSSYPWSKDMGDYFTYCWCSLGITAAPYQTPSTMKRLFPSYRWHTGYNGFSDWYHREVLGLPEGGTHTYYCSQASWIYAMPESFREAVVQGFFDGDGIVDSMKIAKYVAAAAGAQTPFVRELLDSIGLKTGEAGAENKRVVNIKHESFEDAVEVPIFRRAAGRQEVIQRIKDMFSDRTPITQYRDNHSLPLERLIRQLGSNPNRSSNRIAQLLYTLTGNTSSSRRITKLLKTTEEVDWTEVHAFIGFWKRNPTPDRIRAAFELACKETGYQRRGKSRRSSWMRKNIPSSVRCALSSSRPKGDGGWTIETREGSEIYLDKEFLEHHPHIADVIKSYQTSVFQRVQKALENDLEDITSHPRLKEQVNKLTEQMDRLAKTDFNLTLNERPDDHVQLLIDTMRTIQQVGKLKEPIGVQHLTPLLEHNETRIRGVAVIALGKIGSTEAVDALLKTYPTHPTFLKEDARQTKDLRTLWIQALGRIHDQRAIDFLTKKKDDSHTRIRQAATKALKQTRATRKPITNS